MRMSEALYLNRAKLLFIHKSSLINFLLLQVVVSQSQEGFIKGVMLPMYSELCKIDDVLARHHFVNPLKDSLLRYELENIRRK